MDGQQLVVRAASELSKQPSIQAKIRQKVAMFEQYLVGSGSYLQFRSGEKQMFRLELKLQVADHLTSLQQVSDGTTLWIRRDDGENTSLSYVNLWRVRQAMQNRSPQSGVRSDAPTIAIGGLEQLLRALAENFRFREPTPQEFRGLPVWHVRGAWKPEKRTQFLSEPGDSVSASQPRRLDRVPAHVPDTVTLVLGRDDVIPLFPYRIEYGRGTGGDGPKADYVDEVTGEKTATRPIVTMELFEVRRPTDLDARHFVFPLEDQEVEDQTELYLKKLLPPKRDE